MFDNIFPRRLTRRSFLAGLGAASALPVLAACEPQIIEVEKIQVVEREVPVERVVTQVIRESVDRIITVEVEKPVEVERIITVEVEKPVVMEKIVRVEVEKPVEIVRVVEKSNYRRGGEGDDSREREDSRSRSRSREAGIPYRSGDKDQYLVCRSSE